MENNPRLKTALIVLAAAALVTASIFFPAPVFFALVTITAISITYRVKNAYQRQELASSLQKGLNIKENLSTPENNAFLQKMVKNGITYDKLAEYGQDIKKIPEKLQKDFNNIELQIPDVNGQTTKKSLQSLAENANQLNLTENI